MSKRLKKEVENKVSNSKDLTKIQKEILYLLTNEFLSPKKIAYRRKTSISAVYKIIEKLREKGYISGSIYKGFRGLNNFVSTFKGRNLHPPKTTKNFKRYIRLHGQEFNIKILAKSLKYKEGLFMTLDGNKVRTYKNTIEVYCNENLFFEAEDEQRATALSIQYWEKFFRKLENYLGVLIIKERSQNIEQVNGHYSEMDNELAKEYNKKRIKLRIYTKDDGKLWFMIDDSFNLDEAEWLHPRTAKQDTSKVKKTFNDIRDKESYLPSELKNIVDSCTSMIHELASAQLNQTKIINALLPKKEELREEKKVSKEKPEYIG